MQVEIMALGKETRVSVISLAGLDADMLYEDIYCARGQAENYTADSTSCPWFLASCIRVLLYATAWILHRSLRTDALQR